MKNRKVILAMVGLPARGKTYIAKNLSRYLKWIGFKTRIFNLGDYRRKLSGTCSNHTFFSIDNEHAVAIREKCCSEAMIDVCKWLGGDGEVAIFDATNTTRQRRAFLNSTLAEKMGYSLFFIESICDEQTIVESTVREIKSKNPDYRGKNKEEAYTDFMKRIDHYQQRYETLNEKQESYVRYLKTFNAGEKVVFYKPNNLIENKIINYLRSSHIRSRTIYLTRTGESELNFTRELGRNTRLSARGREYAQVLSKFINESDISDLKVLTSSATRSIQAAALIQAPKQQLKALNKMNWCEFDEATYVETKFPFPQDLTTKTGYRYQHDFTNGETYDDIIKRLEAVILQIEHEGNILVISHQKVLQCILAYFLDYSRNEIPNIQVPQNTLFKLTLSGYDYNLEHIPFDIPTIDTHEVEG
ncbi:hypothetical protein QYM36_005394 [Artemia franciscana]|uniref:6-phosphofructo-2-kinase domain-containing protein n=1 Tax=Artemia franciscana TaxID=6661 RepID=A0AA88I2J4_ARTSF|nr:hypothetical protein QYM36_005394 [Artemia franciscana]